MGAGLRRPQRHEAVRLACETERPMRHGQRNLEKVACSGTDFGHCAAFWDTLLRTNHEALDNMPIDYALVSFASASAKKTIAEAVICSTKLTR